jgi:predicted ATPase/DNA-binding SARP family transcriptional activator
MARLSLSLFGPLLVTLDGNAVSFPFWAKTLALLAYLAVQPDRPHRRDKLAGLLWPELPEAAARTNLRQALHQLRQALGQGNPPYLLVTPQTVQFNPAADADVDLAEFGRLITACQEHPHRRLDACRACAGRLERAVALYRGDFLAGLLLKDCVEYEEWMLVQRERFSRQALSVLHTLGEYYRRRGDYGRMEQVAWQQIEIDPFREDAHRQVMQALAWSGRPNAALAHHADLCRTLVHELDVPPERQTAALYEQIRGGEFARPQRSPLRNWRAAPTPLIGRERELADLAGWLESPHLRLITVLGIGGIGKTRLALEAAAQESFAFADGACFVPLAAVSAADFIVPAITAALQITLSGPGGPAAQLCAALGGQELLLILDNFEHLPAGASLVSELLAACPQLSILVTSREPLHLRAEQQFPVSPLALPNLAQLPSLGSRWVDELASVPAVALFVQRARAVRPHFSLTVENAAAVAEICVHLDGLPLAIELAAARMQFLIPQELLARLGSRLALLVGGARDLPARQRTLRATLDWSHSFLSDEEKRLFARLAVFAGGWTLEAAQAVCATGTPQAREVPAGLHSLREKGLLQCQDTGEGRERFSMLETVHEYAREWLAKGGEQAALQGQHAAYYLALVERGQPELKGPQQGVWIERLEREQNNLRAALQWALEQGDAVTSLRLGSALWLFWHVRGHYSEGRRWLDAVSALPVADESGLDRVRAQVLAGAGVLAGDQGDSAWAIGRLEEAAALARQAGDAAGLAGILAWLGWAAYEHGDWPRAVRAYEESLALARQRGPAGEGTVAFVLNALGEVARQRGEQAAAWAYYEESLALWRRLDDALGVRCALQNLGRITYLGGDAEQAGKLFRESLVLAWKDRDHKHMAEAMVGLATVAQAAERSPRAARLLGHAEARLFSISGNLDLSDRADFEGTIGAARAALGESAFEAAFQKGKAMDEQEAVEYALRED